jgi:plastocyanin
MSRRLLASLLLVASLGLAACSDPDDGGGGGAADDGPPADATVDLKPTTFDPEEVTVKVGETVRWKWGGGVQHDVEGEGFKSKIQSKGQFDHTFEEAGSFEYVCNVHPTTMKGTVTVEA